MKEETEAIDKFRKSPKGSRSRSGSSQNNSGSIDIRPKPVICKSLKNISVNKTNLIKTKKQWAPGTWQDDTHTSAFQPYKPSTLLTNLQRGNTRTEIQLPPGGSSVTFYTLAGQGELTETDILPGKIDTPDENGLTALMWAAGYGQLGSVKLLLKHGANTNSKSLHKETPLHFSAAHGHHDVVKLLLNQNADPNACEEEGNTPLIYGTLSDNPHVCSELLTRGADITISNDYGLNAYKLADLKSATKAKTVMENFLLEKVLTLPDGLFEK